MNHATINETINPTQSDITSLFDVNKGEWGDVSKSLTPNVGATIHSNILFIDGEVEAGIQEIIISNGFAFYAKKSILEIYELVNNNYVKSNVVASVDGKKITLPIINNKFLIKGFLMGVFE